LWLRFTYVTPPQDIKLGALGTGLGDGSEQGEGFLVRHPYPCPFPSVFLCLPLSFCVLCVAWCVWPRNHGEAGGGSSRLWTGVVRVSWWAWQHPIPPFDISNCVPLSLSLSLCLCVCACVWLRTRQDPYLLTTALNKKARALGVQQVVGEVRASWFRRSRGPDALRFACGMPVNIAHKYWQTPYCPDLPVASPRKSCPYILANARMIGLSFA
jgi:hypothetical protein